MSGDFVYIGHGENNDDSGQQGRVICLDASQVKDGKPHEVWKVDGIKAKFTSPIIADGRLYITNDAGMLYCLDGKDGKEHWKIRYGKNSKASPVLADSKIYVGEEDGKFHILKPEDKKCTKLHTEAFVGEVINGSAAVANGRVLFMTTDQMFCLGLKEPGKPGQLAAPVKEAANGKAVAHVQVFPADVVLRPGESAELKALAFDGEGQSLGEVKVDWSLAGSRLPEGVPPPPMGTPPPPALQGSLSETMGSVTTKLTIAPPPPPGQFGRVLATVPGTKIVGEVRVRVVHKLPYKADFSKIPEGRTPGGWVNTQGKYGVAKLPEGTFALKKLALNPNALLNRANAYIGMPDWKDYTIETEMMGTKAGDDLPDGGIIANRYTFMLAGNRKELRLVEWGALPRIDKNLPMEFKPNVWYRLKLTVEAKGAGTHVRGKIWEADKPEPKEWTIEVDDPIGNQEGAPGLYAFAPVSTPDPKEQRTETFFRSVAVTPNKTAAPNDKETPREKNVPKPPEQTRAVSPAPLVIEYCEAPRRLFPRLRGR